LAVDGSVIEEGGGTKFTGTINGNEVTDLDTELHKGDTVQISDGTDVTEDYDVETSEIQPEQKEVGTGAIHVYVPGEATQIETRTGKVSGKTVQETVKEGVDSTYLKYEADTGDDKVIALTFDDGPWNTTEEVLDILKANGAKATFFTIGEQISDVDNYTDVIQRMASEGHQIATHSYDHASTGGGNGVDMTRQSAEKQIEEVVDGQKAISDATGEEASKVFRSPGGNYSGDIIWNLEPYVTAEIGWDIDTMDWSRPGVDSIVQSILSADSGDIILMHDGGGDRSQTVEALKQALPQLVAQGYKFVTIDELLAYNDAKEIAQNLESSESSS
jgi:peptidoglycan/xylan/chitin deacetylase (PgdA/CDA1 family)